MSEDNPSDTRLLSAEYKDGQLQIVEVRPFEKSDGVLDTEGTSLPELETDGQTKYVQLVNTDNKSMMQLDLLNLALVRCEDGTESYTLVANGDSAGEHSSQTTVTCVLASSDHEASEEQDNQDTYVMVEGEDGPLVFLQSSLQQASADPHHTAPPATTCADKPPKLSPTEILERAKALQKAKALSPLNPHRRRGRKRKSDLPPPHELLSSPNFKLFLYSCKMCSFKCNAIKEMTAHKASKHGSGGGNNKWRRAASITLQCARCPFKGNTHTQLMNHVQEIHCSDDDGGLGAVRNLAPRLKSDKKQNMPSVEVFLNTSAVAAADVLVCGACGFESASRQKFKAHIEAEHNATACWTDKQSP